MGYTQEGSIRKFWPDDDENTMWFTSEQAFGDILTEVRLKWPTVRIESLTISAEHVHTDCIGYPRYDPSDYTDFIKVSK